MCLDPVQQRLPDLPKDIFLFPVHGILDNARIRIHDSVEHCQVAPYWELLVVYKKAVVIDTDDQSPIVPFVTQAWLRAIRAYHANFMRLQPALVDDILDDLMAKQNLWGQLVRHAARLRAGGGRPVQSRTENGLVCSGSCTAWVAADSLNRVWQIR